MDLLSRIASWLGENEATISAVVGITVLAGVVFAGLRSLMRRRAEVPPEKARTATAEPAPVAEASSPDLNPLTVPGFEGRPAIAVLPFDNLSSDPEQEYFADGIAEDLITRLSAWRWCPVIARNSSFTYKGKAVDVKQVSRELGVRYVVEGSTRKTDDRVRVTAQLIDAATAGHLWAETYDRSLRDIFDIQDEISKAIVGSLGHALEIAEARRAIHKEPQNLDAYDYRMRGLWHLYRFTKEDNRKARAFYEEAMELDPEYADAFSDLATVHYLDNLNQWTDSPEHSLSEQLRAAEKCVKLDNTRPWGHWGLAMAYSLRGERDQAIAAAQLAVEFQPSLAEGHSALGAFLIMAGRPDEGIAHQEKAIRLSPKSYLTSYCMHCISLGHFVAGRYAESVEWEKQALLRNPDYWVSLGTLTSSYSHLGRMEEARSTLEKMLVINPDYSEDAFKMIFSIAEAEFIERWLDGLRKAGLKE